ncbi:hypothetical protein B0H16DRAFT_1454510 [Mycena metata]|uniref:Uncharacterized protein n=1 Tax=Mycena metata TaxID=1033252 RepID=A0AAD7NLD5_9AGAR|nr:hypothetical protein B0H16DRAFT_1454510 [Mycena metata]
MIYQQQPTSLYRLYLLFYPSLLTMGALWGYVYSRHAGTFVVYGIWIAFFGMRAFQYMLNAKMPSAVALCAITRSLSERFGFGLGLVLVGHALEYDYGVRKDPVMGGGRHMFDAELLLQHVLGGRGRPVVPGDQFSFEFQCYAKDVDAVLEINPDCVSCILPISLLYEGLAKHELLRASLLVLRMTVLGAMINIQAPEVYVGC